MPDVIGQVLTNRRLERVAVNRDHALSVMTMAEQHVPTAMVLAALVFVDDESPQEFEWVRRVRNSTEYPGVGPPTATKQDVTGAIEAASVIVEACAKYVHIRE